MNFFWFLNEFPTYKFLFICSMRLHSHIWKRTGSCLVASKQKIHIPLQYFSLLPLCPHLNKFYILCHCELETAWWKVMVNVFFCFFLSFWWYNFIWHALQRYGGILLITHSKIKQLHVLLLVTWFPVLWIRSCCLLPSAQQRGSTALEFAHAWMTWWSFRRNKIKKIIRYMFFQ